MRKRMMLIGAAAAAAMLMPVMASAATAPELPGTAMLRYGSSGPEVAILQADLSAIGVYTGPDNGYFGYPTRAAVLRLQKAAQIGVDGIVGPITWGSIHTRLENDYRVENGALGQVQLEPGDVGAAVLAMQNDLKAKGYNPGPLNGVFLSMAGRALMAFQAANGIPVTENLDSATLQVLTGQSGAVGTSTGSGSTGAPSGSGSTGSSGNSVTTGSSGTTGSTGGNQIDGHNVLGTMQLTATAYAPTLKDNYPYGPVDYYGNPLVAGDVAVDPRVIPLGSLLWVTGYSFSPYLPVGGFLAHAVDTGGAIKGNRIDIFINQSESTVSMFGIQPVKVYLLKP